LPKANPMAPGCDTERMSGERKKQPESAMPHFQRLEFERLSADQQVSRSRQFLETLSTRRSVRMFSSDPVPFEIIENAIRMKSNHL